MFLDSRHALARLHCLCNTFGWYKISRNHNLPMLIHMPKVFDVSRSLKVNVFNWEHWDEDKPEKLVGELEKIVKATDRLIGGPLRREIVQTVNIEEYLDIKRKKSAREIPMVVEGRPFYAVVNDDDDPAVAEWNEDLLEITLRLGKDDRRIPYADFMHEIGHGVYKFMSSQYFLMFSALYDHLKNKFMEKIVHRGWHPVTSASRICSEQFFLGDLDPAEIGYVCWRGYVHQDFEASTADKRNLFHRKRRSEIPRVDAFRINLDADEAFAEFFTYYHELVRKPVYKFIPRRQLPRKKRIHPDLYKFGRMYMRDIIRSARPVRRRTREIPVSD